MYMIGNHVGVRQTVSCSIMQSYEIPQLSAAVTKAIVTDTSGHDIASKISYCTLHIARSGIQSFPSQRMRISVPCMVLAPVTRNRLYCSREWKIFLQAEIEDLLSTTNFF